jgi:acyl-CoA synthetase (AMP-forming)/AMP-acid ligase II
MTNSVKYPYLVRHFLESSAARLPDKIALVCGAERLVYQQINHFADQVAASLIDMGIRRQNRVALLLENSVESTIFLFCRLKACATIVMLSPTITPKYDQTPCF